MFEKIARIRKALVAAIPFALSVFGEFVSVESPLYVKVVAFLGAVGVYLAPNKPAPVEPAPEPELHVLP